MRMVFLDMNQVETTCFVYLQTEFKSQTEFKEKNR